MPEPVLVFERVSKAYAADGVPDRIALDGISFRLEPGSTVALVGRSGSGKSTLLHVAAGIETPTGGRVLLAGRDLGRASEAVRTRLRREHVGLVFQFFHLLPHLTVFENVVLPVWISGSGRSAAGDRARELLGRVGLRDRAGDRIDRLSGGEMQRVAICRALVAKPPLLLADEPTGNLDDASGRAVMDLLFELVREEGATLLVATHSRELAARVDAEWRLHSGVLEGA